MPSIPPAAIAFGIFVLLGLIAVALAVAIVIDAFLINPLAVGAYRFSVCNLNQKAQAKEAAYAFDSGNYLEIAKTMILRDVFIALWSLLLIIPGIVKAYEYRMIPYLLADDPTMTKDRAFAESRAMMRGNKWRAFVLDLSFLGWHILSVFTLGILELFYVAPYEFMADAALYESLRYGTPAAEQVAYSNAAQIPTSLTTPAATLTSVLTTSMGNEAMGTVYNDALWSLALILLVMSLVFILIVRLIGRAGKVRGNA